MTALDSLIVFVHPAMVQERSPELRRHVRTMMLANAKDLQAQLVGEPGLFIHSKPQTLAWRHVGISDLSKCGQSEFHAV